MRHGQDRPIANIWCNVIFNLFLLFLHFFSRLVLYITRFLYTLTYALSFYFFSIVSFWIYDLQYCRTQKTAREGGKMSNDAGGAMTKKGIIKGMASRAVHVRTHANAKTKQSFIYYFK